MTGVLIVCGYICTISIAAVIFFHYKDKKAERKQKEN